MQEKNKERSVGKKKENNNWDGKNEISKGGGESRNTGGGTGKMRKRVCMLTAKGGKRENIFLVERPGMWRKKGEIP